jgi:hypothetical protein
MCHFFRLKVDAFDAFETVDNRQEVGDEVIAFIHDYLSSTHLSVSVEVVLQPVEAFHVGALGRTCSSRRQ